VALQLTDSSALCDAALEHISFVPNIVVLELSDSPEYAVRELKKAAQLLPKNEPVLEKQRFAEQQS
jgi:hypothetical protein